MDATALTNLSLNDLINQLRREAEGCLKCQGTRETVFTSRGRDNIVNCLECEPLYQALEHLTAARKILKAG